MRLNRSLDVPKNLLKDYIGGKINISAVFRSKETGKIIQYGSLMPEDKLVGVKKMAENIGSKNLFLGIGITAAVVTIGGIISLIVNKPSEKTSVKIPKCVNDFQEKFHKYLNEAQKGVLNVKTIDELLDSLNEIKKLKDKEIKIDFSTKELKFILNKIYDFTNSINEEQKKLQSKIKAPSNNSSKNIVYLKDYLQLQKQAAEKAL